MEVCEDRSAHALRGYFQVQHLPSSRREEENEEKRQNLWMLYTIEEYGNELGTVTEDHLQKTLSCCGRKHKSRTS
jgi:hypothetical protein